MKALLLAGAIACIVITAKATQQAGTEPANGLRMSLAHDEAASGPDKAMHFTVTFSNLKHHDVGRQLFSKVQRLQFLASAESKY